MIECSLLPCGQLTVLHIFVLASTSTTKRWPIIDSADRKFLGVEFLDQTDVSRLLAIGPISAFFLSVSCHKFNGCCASHNLRASVPVHLHPCAVLAFLYHSV